LLSVSVCCECSSRGRSRCYGGIGPGATAVRSPVLRRYPPGAATVSVPVLRRYAPRSYDGIDPGATTVSVPVLWRYAPPCCGGTVPRSSHQQAHANGTAARRDARLDRLNTSRHSRTDDPDRSALQPVGHGRVASGVAQMMLKTGCVPAGHCIRRPSFLPSKTQRRGSAPRRQRSHVDQPGLG
jgi:hypothetical protein